MITNFKVLSCWGYITSPCLLLSYDDVSYVFQCPEGTQRAFLEDSTRLSKLSCVFLTSLHWYAVGGLPGFSLTVTDAVERCILKAIGIETTAITFASLALGMGRRKMPIPVMDYIHIDTTSTQSYNVILSQSMLNKTPQYIDDHISLWALPTSSAKRHVSLVIKTAQQLGKFHKDKAMSLGVKPGPLYGKLQKGESVSVTLDNGEESVILPDQVSDPPVPSDVILVLDCDADWLCCLPDVSPPSSCRYTAVFHVSHPSVLSHDKYQSLVSNIKADHHVYCVSPMAALRAPTRAAEILHSVDAQHVLIPPLMAPCPISDVIPVSNQRHPGTNICLHPPKMRGISVPDTPNITPDNCVPSRNNLKSNVGITCLGTGAAMPSKYRNVSSALLNIGSGYVLLDCGEGTLSQLMWAMRGDDDILRHLRCIWISHSHADHWMGVPRFIEEIRALNLRSNDGCQRLVVIAPTIVNRFLEGYCGSDVCRYVASSIVTESDRKDLDLDLLISVPVDHNADSMGLILAGHTSSYRWMMAYTGDCCPSHDFVVTGNNVVTSFKPSPSKSLLIHEATFDDGMEAEASVKHHSTQSQAVKQAEDMGVNTLLLTHFSQRYPKTVEFNGKHDVTVVLAYDFLTFSLGETPSMDTSVISKLFES